MTRVKNLVLGLVAAIVALGAFGFFASIGLAVLGMVALATGAMVLAGWAATAFAAKRDKADI